MSRLTMVLVMAGAVTLLTACDDATSLPGSSLPGGDGEQSAVPEWTGQLVLGKEPLTADDAGTQEELPGLGHKFQLLFAMEEDVDLQNPTNEVIAITTTPEHPAGAGVAVRNLPPGIRITALENQINLKYFFPGNRTCAGGSPRIQLAISRDGDREPDANAFGYVGHLPFGAGCVTGDWDIIDMTDQVGRWDLSQFGGGMTTRWDDVETFFTTTYPNHRVLSGSLVDDSCSFAPGACGKAYYDLLTVENRTLENWQDAVERKR